jgi:hypothetical protein
VTDALQNTAYEWLNNNATTPWDFSKYSPTPTHVVVNIGTNDRAFGFNGTFFETVCCAPFCMRPYADRSGAPLQEYITFLHQLRGLYPHAPIFVMSPWGFPTPYGVVPYFDAEDSAVLAGVNDKNVFLVNGTGWIQYGDTFPECVNNWSKNPDDADASAPTATRIRRRTVTAKSPTT